MVKCENCKIEHNNNYGKGRFCSSKCAKSYSAKFNKNKTKDAKCIKCNNEIIISINASANNCICDKCKSLTKLNNRICKFCGQSKKDCLNSRPDICKNYQIFSSLIK